MFKKKQENFGKYRVKRLARESIEAEEIFLDQRKKTFKDKLHFGGEERLRVVGKTRKGKLLFIAFTRRKGRIRIISARNINKKEVYLYIS